VKRAKVRGEEGSCTEPCGVVISMPGGVEGAEHVAAPALEMV